MAVAFDAISKSGTGLTGATPNPMTWTHTPVGTPRGVIVFAYQESGIGPTVTAASYGGVAMQRSAFATQLSGGEGGAIDAYFLGAGLPTGAQTVSVDHNGSAGDTRWIVAITVTADTDTEIIAADTIIGNTETDPTFTFDTGTRVALRLLAAASGTDTAGTIAGISGSTAIESIDTGARGAYIIRANSAASGSATVGATAASEDVAVVGLAVAEVDTTLVRHDTTTVGSTFTTTTPHAFNHTPIGTPAGVIVSIYNDTGADPVTAVTYGGVTMDRIGHVASAVHTETGGITKYFLGEGIPTGTQSVSITHTGSAATKQAVCQTLTAPADTLVVVSGSLDSASEQFPSLTLDSGTESGLMVFGGMTGDLGLQVSTGASTLFVTSQTIGAKGLALGRAAVARTGSQSLAFKLRAADEAVMFGAVIGLAAPAAPTVLTATAISLSRIDLAWTDNATNEDGFRIERSANGVDGWVDLGDVAANTVTYSDTGLTPSTTYYYRVFAFNDAGDSDPSNVASATTLADFMGDTPPYTKWFFYRTPTGDLALVESHDRLRLGSWNQNQELHEQASDRFRTNRAITHSQIQLAVATAWAAHSGSAIATLKAAIHDDLTAYGVLSVDGTALP